MKSFLYQAALEIQEFFVEKGWEFAFIGGLALLRWGRRRTTEDVDGTLLTLFLNEGRMIDEILERFQSRIEDAKAFAMDNRVLLLAASNGIGIDLSLGGWPFEQSMVERSSLFAFEEDCVLRTCSAEDLVVLKAFADREKDWGDIRSILQKQKGKLDLEYVFDNLVPLCELKKAPEIVEHLRDAIENVS